MTVRRRAQTGRQTIRSVIHSERHPMPIDIRWPDVILVNGPSSAGKTTLCRALQAGSSILTFAWDSTTSCSSRRRGTTAAPIPAADSNRRFHRAGRRDGDHLRAGRTGNGDGQVRPCIPPHHRRDGPGGAGARGRRQRHDLRPRAARPPDVRELPAGFRRPGCVHGRRVCAIDCSRRASARAATAWLVGHGASSTWFMVSATTMWSSIPARRT